MGQRFVIASTVFSLGSLLLLTAVPAQSAGVPDHVPGRLLLTNRTGADSLSLDRTLALHRATVRSRLEPLAVTVLEVPEDSAAAVRESLLRTGLFDDVEFDHYARSGAVPNDPSFGSQWHLAKIQAPQAWNVTTGAVSVPVAVIDSGADPVHPDLAGKLVSGWNFVRTGGSTTDVLGHGTAVAGTIASASNNGIGGAGVSWSSPVMPLLVVDDNDFAAYSNIAAAIQYAVDHGVHVINISIGGPSPSTILQNAVDYAWSKGAIIVASAMNNTTSDLYFPAACTHVIAVSATDSNDHLAGFSNYGNWITIAAPGTNILTTVNGGGYGYWFGTSFSSPIVAGVAALCFSVNPALTNAEVVSLLLKNADDIGAPGFDSLFGWGRVNAYTAVMAARQTLPQPHGRPRPTQVQLRRNPPRR